MHHVSHLLSLDMQLTRPMLGCMTQLKTQSKHARGGWTRFADRTVAECTDELSVIVDLRQSELTAPQPTTIDPGSIAA